MKPNDGDGAKELNRLEVLRGLRIATYEASFATVWATLTTGIFLVGFALWLGANNLVIGLVTAIPTFAGLIQIVSSYFGERMKSRKSITAWFSLLGRGLWLPILLLPIFLPRHLALYPFLILLTLSYIALNIPLPAYMSWMSDLVPPDHRGRYFGRRNMIAGIVGMALALPAAKFLDFTTRQHDYGRVGYGILFGVAILGGIASFVCLLRQPEPPRHPAPPREDAPQGLAGVIAYYKTPFTDKNFMRLMLFNVIFGLGQNFAAPFYMVYAVKNLNVNYTQLQVFATMTSIASLASMPLWGYLSDRFGNKPLLVIGAFGTATLPWYWIMVNQSRPSMMLLLLCSVHLMGGLSWAGVQLTQFNLLISLSPSQKTPIYVATMSAVTGLTGGLAPMVGSVLMKSMEGWSAHFLGNIWLNFHLTFLVSSTLRFSALFLLRGVHDSRSATTREVIQQLTRANPRIVQSIRRLQRSGDIEEKLKATEALGVARTTMAVSELETALRDPNPEIRIEAAHALGEIGDVSAVEALLHAIRDPGSGVVEEAAHALGRIGDRQACATLLNLLMDTDSPLHRRERSAVIKALGDLGGGEVSRALLSLLQTSTDTEEKECLVRALGEIGDPLTLSHLVRELQTDPPRPLLLALLRALGELDGSSVRPLLRERLATFGNDPILLPAIADVLARIGDEESLLPLLHHLQSLESVVARKQVAVAMGKLLGEGEAVYSLLSQEGFGREEAFSKTLQELLRQFRTALPDRDTNILLERYVGGEFVGFMQALHTLLLEMPDSSAVSLLGRFVDSAVRLPEAHVEEVILTVLALCRLMAT
ncbi:MAG: MFS transporter [Armatimonadetes bacterium]|nr:MFS transporter [Armatimonadota bacterium]